MPSKSKAQHKLMNAAAHNKEFAEKVGVPQEVARHYLDEDKKLKPHITTEKIKRGHK